MLTTEYNADSITQVRMSSVEDKDRCPIVRRIQAGKRVVTHERGSAQPKQERP